MAQNRHRKAGLCQQRFQRRTDRPVGSLHTPWLYCSLGRKRKEIHLPLPSWRFCRSEEHTSELQSRLHLVCRLLLEKKKKIIKILHARYTSRVERPLNSTTSDVA